MPDAECIQNFEYIGLIFSKMLLRLIPERLKDISNVTDRIATVSSGRSASTEFSDWIVNALAGIAVAFIAIVC